MEGCVFCEIGSGLHDTFLYSDDACFVILDKFPAERGHVLVISKEHHDSLLATPDETVSRMFTTAKRFAVRCKERLGATGVSVITNSGKDAGQVIPHTHVHVIPRYGPSRTHAGSSRTELKEADAAELRILLSKD